MSNKKIISELLESTNRPGVTDLIAHMDKGGFFESPCSGKYHLAEEGGLAEHSLNVYSMMAQLRDTLNPSMPMDSIVLTALLHDLGKMGAHNKPNYIEKLVRSKAKNKETGEYDMVRSSAEPFTTNPELLYIPHEVRSIVIAEQFIDLTEEEEHAIYYHNGKYTHIGYDLKETPLSMMLHFADMWASRVIEAQKEEL